MNKSKNILLSTDDPGVGGVAQYNHSLLRGLLDNGYRVSYVQPRLETDNEHLKIQQSQLDIQHYKWLDKDKFQNLVNLLTTPSSPYDLIICSNSLPSSNFAIKQLAIQLIIPYIIVENFVHPSEIQNLSPDDLEDLSHHYDRAEAVIAVSQDNLNLLHQLFRLPENKGQVIYYGRPSEYFTKKNILLRDRLRQEFSIPSNAVVCFTAANMYPRKGYQYQLKAIKQLMTSPVWSQIYFLWAGSCLFGQAFEDQIKSEVKQMGITEKVKFLGQRSDVPDLLNAADIFVFTSELEGMPLGVMEAMAKGLPVIATAVSGIPEELGGTGKLLPDPKVAPQATVAELVATIEAWVTNPDLLDSIGKACQERALEIFTEKRMIQETMQVIERALGSAAADDVILELKDINLIVFPDWSQPEESLALELKQVIRALATHSQRSKILLLIYTDVSEEEANLILSSITMSLLMESDLDVSSGPEISLIFHLDSMQWLALSDRIKARIILDKENEQAIEQAKVGNIPKITLDSWQTIQNEE